MIKADDEVVLLDLAYTRLNHEKRPLICPAPGTHGKVRRVCFPALLVQWEKGSTSESDIHWIEEEYVEKVKPCTT